MGEVLMAVDLAVTALLAAALGLAVLTALTRRTAGAGGLFAEAPGATVFLFDGEALADATPGARALIRQSPLRSGPALPRLIAWAEPRFPDLGAALARLPAEGRVALASEGEGAALVLSAESRGGLLRLTLADAGAAPAAEPVADRTLREELDQHRATLARAPLPIWREDAEGRAVWGNAAYLDLALRGLDPGQELTWPLPCVFADPAPAAPGKPPRACIPGPSGTRDAWFEIAAFEEPGGRLAYALPADSAVQAETSLRGFMQTLTKTFAQLRTGLAIFDEARQLQLFNPALLDLTTLSAEFLSARPTLAMFFDALRDRSMIPEPRDYRSWRRQMVEMEAAAASGLYDEVWTLPSGQIYRVTGRPHPDGALALMFEDITAEMSQTRRYRADLELGQSVIDALEDAVAVFSHSGTLVMSNAAYAGLWGHDPGASLGGGVTVAALAEHWRSLSAPTTLWDRVEDDVVAMGPLAGWTDAARLTDGRAVACRLARLAGGATLVLFRETPADEALAQPAPTFATARRA